METISSFLAELFCSLTGNILGLKSRGGRRADDVWTTRERDFVGDFSWQMTYVIRTSSACHPHMHTSSAHHLHIVRTTPRGQRGPELSFTVTGICYLMEFVAGMLNCFISGSCK